LDVAALWRQLWDTGIGITTRAAMLWNKYQDFGWKSQDQVGQIVLSSDQNYKA